MMTRAIRMLVVACIATASAVLSIVPAVGDEPGNGAHPLDPQQPTATPIVSVQSGPNGVTVIIRVTQQAPGNTTGPSSSTSVSTGSQPSCRISIANIGIVLSQSPWYQQGVRDHPNHVLGTVFCDDGFSTTVWIPMGTPTNATVQVVFVDGDAVDPVSVALELLNHLPIPNISIEANPSTGLVALPSWFWVDGYDGSLIGSSDTLSGIQVDVEVEPLLYRWSFGDGGAVATTSLGHRYPIESDIQHVYEQSSLAAGGAYTIAVEVTFAARYRVNGGVWEALDPITRTFSDNYRVQQLQSVLTGQPR